MITIESEQNLNFESINAFLSYLNPLDFRELRKSEITSEILEAKKEAEGADKSRFLNLQ